MADQPTVSVVMPVRNEAEFIERALAAVLEQDFPADEVEVLVVDGMSSDDTRSIIERTAAAHGREVTVLDNPAGITPTALNTGIAAAKGDVIVRVDGHCVIAPDYVSTCVRLLREGGYDNVGGRCDTEASTEAARVIALAQSSSFGVGNVAFRTQRAEAGPADTVPFGAFPRAVFDRIGGFDEELVRNQDDELNFRLIQSGGVVWYDPAIRSRYFSRSTIRRLWRQYWQYGLYKVRVAQKRNGLAAGRQLVPAVFVAGLAGSAALAAVTRQPRWLAVVAGPYAAANLAASASLGRKERAGVWRLAVAFATLHTSYGAGFLAGLWKWRDGFRGAGLRSWRVGTSERGRQPSP